MRDQGLIYAGLAVFLGLLTLPFTLNLAAGRSAAAPEIKLPANERQCVAPREYMRKSHMDLLVNWREDVVRRNIRTFRTADGRTFEMSLTNTCMTQCHTSKQDFCDSCHNYVGVQGPFCMDCHNAPRQQVAEARR